MSPVLRAGYLFTICAAALAWGIARRRPEHRPVALLLTIDVVINVARRALAAYVLVPAAAQLGGAPLDGWARVAGHLDDALFLGWPAAIAATALVTFTPALFDEDASRARRRRVMIAVAIVWAVAVAALVTSYPITRGAVLARCYLAGELAAIVVGLGSVATWIPARQSPDVRHVAIALVVGDALVSVLAGPWRFNVFGSWVLAQLIHALFAAVLTVLQGGFLWSQSLSLRR